MSSNDISLWSPLFERLDRLRVQGILEADRRCRKLKCGNIPWSPIVQQCMNTIGYLQACRNKFVFHKMVHSRTLSRLFRKTDLTHPVHTGETAEAMLKSKYNELNLLKSKASHFRSDFLAELAEHKAESGTADRAAVILKQLLLREEQRAIAKSTKRALRTFKGGVTAIEAKTEQGEWAIFTDQCTIEQNCIKENIARFTQASHLPIMQLDSIRSLGWFAETPVAQHVLKGSVSESELDGMDESIQRMVPYLNTPPQIQEIDCSISTSQYIYEWSKGREFTATGVSQVHFGHFKASCLDTSLVELDRWMAELSFKTGYSLLRWKKGIDVMIPKKSNSLRAEQLRTIVLMEADFNFLNKLAGKRIMENAENAQSVAEEQFGSRKAKGAINHAVNKQLALDIMRQEKRKFTLVILDAKGCYDRIAPPMASLSLKRQGTPDAYVFMLFSTIQEMQHLIRTAYGDSRDYYQQEDIPFHGILQGNGAGPTIWAMVSTPLLNRLRAKGYGITIASDDGPIHIPAFAFVDDTDLVQDNEQDEGIQLTQQSVSEWEDALRATGGLLVPNKCKFFVVSYEWKNDRWKLVDQIDAEVELRILDDSGQSHTITQLKAGASELALGIMLSPSGNMDDETKYLRDKAVVWADKIRSSHLSPKETWYCLNATILRAIEYALPATTMSWKQLQSVVQPILNVGLSRSGICRKVSRNLIFAPIKYQGFGIRHPFISQGIAKILLLFESRQVLSQRLIDTSWYYTMVESGLGSQFLTKNCTWIQDVITNGWIKSLWEFVSRYGITVCRADMKHHRQPRHQRDRFLMELAMDRGADVTKADRITFNLCRLYLQVALVSDLTTADGSAIRPNIWNGIRQDTGEGWWPKQPRPSEKAWNLWRRLLQLFLQSDNQGRFFTPFPKTNPTDDWRWFLHEASECLYEKRENGWIVYSRMLRARITRNRCFGNARSCDSVPVDELMAVTTYIRGEGRFINGIGTTNPLPAIKIAHWYDSVWTEEKGDISAIQAAFMSQQTILLLSDGSAKDNLAAAAWILTTESLFLDGVYLAGYAKIPGVQPDSHRAECFGIFGGLKLLMTCMDRWHVHPNLITFCVGCDNISALGSSFLPRRHIGANSPDFDILQAIRRLLVASGLKPTWRHVKGHQSGPNLDIWALLNNMMDELAGKARESNDLPAPPHSIHLGWEKWQLHLSNVKITKDSAKLLYDHCSQPDAKDTWHRYKRVDMNSFDFVNWDVLERAMKESTIQQRHWISKRAARDCGCNYVRFKRKERNDDGCPFCGESETVIHILTCPSVNPTQVWDKPLDEFRLWLMDQNTDPAITQEMVDGLTLWRNNPENDIIDNDNPLIQQQSMKAALEYSGEFNRIVTSRTTQQTIGGTDG